MKLTATCPSCGAELELEDIAPGTEFACPGCGAPCTAPGAPSPSPAPAPRRTLRIPARRDTAAPLSVVVQTPQRGVFATAFRGCAVLLVMAALLFGAGVSVRAVLWGNPFRSPWEVDERTPALVNRGVGGTLAISGQGPSVVTLFVHDYNPATIFGSRDCTGVLLVGGREIRRDRWIGGASFLLVLDGTADPGLPRAFLRDLLAAGERGEAEIRIPLSSGIEGRVRLRLRGLRAAAARAGYL